MAVHLHNQTFMYIGQKGLNLAVFHSGPPTVCMLCQPTVIASVVGWYVKGFFQFQGHALHKVLTIAAITWRIIQDL